MLEPLVLTLRSSFLPMLLNRFLGNKSAILNEILQATASQADPGDRVLDIFSGSLAVSMGYKTAGYRVTANDLNQFSETFGRAYLENSCIPQVDLNSLLDSSRVRFLRLEAARYIMRLVGNPGYNFLNDSAQRDQFIDLVALFKHLELADEDHVPRDSLRSDFHDYYCPEGRFSGYHSTRGAKGYRRFFTAENAQKLDLMMSLIRQWRGERLLTEHVHAVCLAAICSAVEKVANTQGTYHDFIRERWDSRALKPMTLVPPPLDDVLGGVGGHVVSREDSSTFVRDAGPHRVLYVDPPYNFRQYSAYYFLPNFICDYPDIADLDTYLSEIEFVRGQHPSDITTSPFCSATRFLEAMYDLLAAAEVESIILSYFTGRNHWSDFDRGRDDTGLEKLTQLLESGMFVPGSIQVIEIPRRNYASYVGYRARDVTELLLIANKR